MKLQQLEYVLEITRQGFHISAAAKKLYTSQPAVSRQLQILEAELGFPIFARSRNHIEGLTEAGEMVVEIAQRIIADVDNLTRLKDDLMSSSRGTLTIATTHTLANYVLPQVIAAFIKSYPDVQVVLIQGDPESICELVDKGEADIAVGTDSLEPYPRLVELPCLTLERIVVAPVGHPILDTEHLTLAEISQYPIITYAHRFSGYWKVRAAFESAGLTPNVALSAIDAGVCKTYVSIGLGVGIMASVTFDADRDTGLRAIPAGHLFETSTVYARVRANTYLRKYLLDFINRISPRLKPAVVREYVERGRGQERMAPSP